MDPIPNTAGFLWHPLPAGPVAARTAPAPEAASTASPLRQRRGRAGSGLLGPARSDAQEVDQALLAFEKVRLSGLSVPMLAQVRRKLVGSR